MRPLREKFVRIAVYATCIGLCGFQPPSAQGQSGGTPAWRQEAPRSTRGPRAATEEIRAFFDHYLRLHASKDMDAWVKTFLPEAVCVRTGDDGKVIVYRAAELAASIAEEAKKLDSQHETLEDVRIEAEGDAAVYSTRWRLFHNGKEIRSGRAFFSLVRRDGSWRIAALVWYRAAGSGAR